MFVGVGTGNCTSPAIFHLGDARVLQGRPVPRRRLGHARDERLGRHHARWAACASTCRITHAAFVDLLPGDRRHRRRSRASSPRTRSWPARSSPMPRAGRRASASSCGWCCRWPRSARRSTCGACTSWCSRASSAPTRRPGRTSTSRRSSMTGPLVDPGRVARSSSASSACRTSSPCTCRRCSTTGCRRRWRGPRWPASSRPSR